MANGSESSEVSIARLDERVKAHGVRIARIEIAIISVLAGAALLYLRVSGFPGL